MVLDKKGLLKPFLILILNSALLWCFESLLRRAVESPPPLASC